MSFAKSASEGKYAEKLVLELFKAHGITTELNDKIKADFLFFDLKFEFAGKAWTAEIKFDKMQSSTGNIAVEYFNTKKNCYSGIMATKSDLWITVLQRPDTVWITRTSSLLNYFDLTKPVRDVQCGGDSNSSMRLYKSHEILHDIFINMTSLTTPDFHDKLLHLLKI